MNSFFHLLCNPIVIFGILLVTAVMLRLFKKERKSLFFLSLAIFWIVLVSTTPFPQWIIFELEKQYATIKTELLRGDSAVCILVLGGGHSIAPDLPAGSQLSSAAMVRLTEGIRIHRQLPGSKIICSGNSTSGRVSQAQMLAQAAIDLGVNSSDTLQSRSPRNTSEEIRAYRDRIGSKATLVIVTSAYHMPRVMLLCENEGLKAIPAPTDFYIKKDPLGSNFDFYPYTLKIQMAESAFHEYAGMVKAKMN